jgi:hypothetical protein
MSGLTPMSATDTDVRHRHLLRLGVLTFLLLVLAALAGPLLLALGSRSSATFGASEDLGQNRLGAATLDLTVGTRTVSITAPNMAPGDREVGQIELVNSGDLPLRYTLLSDADTSALLPLLRWDLWIEPGGCGSEPRGLELVSGATLTSGSAAVIGDPTTGTQAGDRVLGAGERELICIAVELPAGAADAVQATTLAHQFVAVAEHAIAPDTSATPPGPPATPVDAEEPTP